jgi:uncharacterized membrane protein YGL010W
MLMEDYLIEYGKSHQNNVNKLIHKVCVPIIMLTIIMLLDSIPFLFPLSWILVIFSLVFYIVKKTPLKLLILIIIQGICFLIISFKTSMPWRFYAGSILFSLAWIFQFIGHNIEGKRPSFLRDMFYLLIGPIWVYSDLLKK